MAVTLRHLGPVLGTAFQARGNDRYGDPRVEINCIIPQWSMGTKGGDSKAPCISLCLVCNGSNRRQRLQAQRPSYHTVEEAAFVCCWEEIRCGKRWFQSLQARLQQDLDGWHPEARQKQEHLCTIRRNGNYLLMCFPTYVLHAVTLPFYIMPTTGILCCRFSSKPPQ